MDFVLALFPWLVTWRLRIKKIEKIGICLTMSLGVVVAVISTWRTVYIMDPNVNHYDSRYFCKFPSAWAHCYMLSHSAHEKTAEKEIAKNILRTPRPKTHRC